MTTKLIIGAIVLVLAGTGIYVATDSDEAATDQTASATPTPAATATTAPLADSAPASQAKPAGQYLDYREGVLASATGQRVLFFHASWCAQCRSIEKGIKSDGVPAGISIIKVDYDSHEALRQKYGIRVQTSFIKVDANGNPQGQPFVAYDDPTFDSVKRNFLQ